MKIHQNTSINVIEGKIFHSSTVGTPKQVAFAFYGCCKKKKLKTFKNFSNPKLSRFLKKGQRKILLGSKEMKNKTFNKSKTDIFLRFYHKKKKKINNIKKKKCFVIV